MADGEQRNKLVLAPDLEGGIHAGYEPDGYPMFHTVARAMPGVAFKLALHWPCPICARASFTLQQFLEQWPTALAAFKKSQTRKVD